MKRKFNAFLKILLAVMLLMSIIVTTLFSTTNAEFFKSFNKKLDLELVPDLRLKYYLRDSISTDGGSGAAQFNKKYGYYDTAEGFSQNIIIGKNTAKNLFTISTNLGEYQANKVVLAFGGSVGKQFGTDGSSYSLATDLGHRLTKLYPSLVQLKTKTDSIKGLKGIKETACVKACDGDKTLASATGDVLFTEFGVSGNAVFQISGFLATAQNPIVKLSFVPELSIEQLEKQISLRQNLDYVDKEEVLSSIVNKQLGRAIIKAQKDKSANGLACALKDFTLQVTGNLGFNNAQVTKGGISTQQICPNTFESKLINGLYIVGEALDVDGDCGGYNLTFAFASAITCAKDIKCKI